VEKREASLTREGSQILGRYHTKVHEWKQETKLSSGSISRGGLKEKGQEELGQGGALGTGKMR
jgi:hypothetical protein